MKSTRWEKCLYHFQFSSHQRFYAVKMFLTLIAKSKCTIQICLQSKREKWKFVLLTKTHIYQQQPHADYVQALCFNSLCCEGLNEVKNANLFLFFSWCARTDVPFGLDSRKGRLHVFSIKKSWNLWMDHSSEMVEKLLCQMRNVCVVLSMRLITRTTTRRELFSRTGHERLETVLL